MNRLALALMLTFSPFLAAGYAYGGAIVAELLTPGLHGDRGEGLFLLLVGGGVLVGWTTGTLLALELSKVLNAVYERAVRDRVATEA